MEPNELFITTIKKIDHLFSVQFQCMMSNIQIKSSKSNVEIEIALFPEFSLFIVLKTL